MKKRHETTKLVHSEKVTAENVSNTEPIHHHIDTMPVYSKMHEVPHINDTNRNSTNTHTEETPLFVQKLLPGIKYVANIIIVLLILALVVTILYKLYILFFIDLFAGDFTAIINDLLLTLILIELFTILYSYLQKHYIKVERVVELGMISIIREMLFKVDIFEANKIYAVAVLLLAFGAVFFIEKYYSKMRNV